MKIIVGIATQNKRAEALKQAIDSLKFQCDEIFIYNNDKNRFDYTSHAKFYQLQFLQRPVYFFSCDDDLIYPPDYVEKMKTGIKKHNCIVTAHGRILVQENKYYKGKHICFKHCGSVPEDVIIDTAGTGCTAFRTDYFNPVDLYKFKYPRMSDLAFSLEAKKQGKKIVCINHPHNWIKSLHLNGIMQSNMKKGADESRQVELMKQIIELK